MKATDAPEPLTANDLTKSLLLEIPQRFPNVRVWRNNRIEATTIGRGGKKRRVSAGIDGQGDISGIAAVSIAGMTIGIRLEIEVKAKYLKGEDKLRPTQTAFRAMIEKHGGCYCVAKDVAGCVSQIREFMSTRGHFLSMDSSI